MGLTGVFTTSRRGVGSRRSKRLSVLLSVMLTMAMVLPSLSIAVPPTPPTGPTTWYVDIVDGSSAKEGTIDSPFKNIYWTVDNKASSGDTIMVNGGDEEEAYRYRNPGLEIYPIRIDFDLTIKGYGENRPILDHSGDPSDIESGDPLLGSGTAAGYDGSVIFDIEPVEFDPIITGLAATHLPIVPTVSTAPPVVTLEGLVFIGGEGVEGTRGGAVSASEAILTVRECEFKNNLAWMYGGALGAVDSTVTVKDSLFLRNEAGYAGGAMYFEDSKVDIVNSIVVDNVAHPEAVPYPRIDARQDAISDYPLEPGFAMDDSTPDSCGGGIAAVGASEMTICNTGVYGNEADMAGGVYCDSWARFDMSDCVIQGNEAFEGGGVASFPSRL